MKKIIINGTIFLVLATALFLAGCSESWPRIEGNRNVVAETRSVPSFVRVYNSGVFEVYVIQADYHEVVLDAESNLLPHIRTRVGGNTLFIETKDNLKPHYPIKVYVYSPVFEEVKLSGSGLIYSDSLHVGVLDVVLSGSGDIDMHVYGDDVYCEISGSGTSRMYVETINVGANISGSGNMYFAGFADLSDLRISGSGSIHAYDLPVIECYTNTSGSGNMYVNVSDYLDVKISGSGSVFYLGNPMMNINISGSGAVIHP
jgi:hypothetical protein